jgi:quinoprotein glucose dehydrogenase
MCLSSIVKRRTHLSRSRSGGAAIGSAGRIGVADAAVAREAGALCAASVFLRRDHRYVSRLPTATALERFARLRPHLPFQPPSTEGTIIFPGFDGGAEWGGAAVDPEGVLYVNSNEMPWMLTMVSTRSEVPGLPARGQQLFNQICAPCHGMDRRGNAAQNVPTLIDVGARLTAEQVQSLLETGRGVMPSFGFLSAAQKLALTDFLFDRKPEGQDGSREEAVAGEDVLGGIPYTPRGTTAGSTPTVIRP